MASSFSWLDYRNEERDEMLQLINELKQPEARDEMGIGRVRDKLADLLFPGTSTIQTRVRYFLFIPWIYKIIEEKGLYGEEASQEARKLEGTLIKTLGPETEGLIGRIAGSEVKRLASSVYWNGLYTWGIRKKPYSQREYHNSLRGYYHRKDIEDKQNASSARGDERDTSKVHDNWETLPRPKSFPSSSDDAALSMQLTKKEAEFLQEMLRMHPKSASTNLLRFLLSERYIPAENLRFPWDLPEDLMNKIRNDLVLGRLMTHARNFSEVLLGVQLLYNFYLAKAAETLDMYFDRDYRQELYDWSEALMGPRLEQLRLWAARLDEDFWPLIGLDTIPPKTKTFIDLWIRRAVEDPASVADDSQWRLTIVERESELKGSKARLKNNDALRLWAGAAGVSQLDYRWPTARNFLHEICMALEEQAHVTA